MTLLKQFNVGSCMERDIIAKQFQSVHVILLKLFNPNTILTQNRIEAVSAGAHNHIKTG